MKVTVEVPTVREGKTITAELDTDTNIVKLRGFIRPVKLDDLEKAARQLRNTKDGL